MEKTLSRSDGFCWRKAITTSSMLCEFTYTVFTVKYSLIRSVRTASSPDLKPCLYFLAMSRSLRTDASKSERFQFVSSVFLFSSKVSATSATLNSWVAVGSSDAAFLNVWTCSPRTRPAGYGQPTTIWPPRCPGPCSTLLSTASDLRILCTDLILLPFVFSDEGSLTMNNWSSLQLQLPAPDFPGEYL
ncbi:hypothetical protein, variant [Phytophthora nicotianae INRA-310]|uniref:Uncharacterized protein n=1 Tax=Phytophthora nicotianae (strain INRA-310) TaxID=761204 RepID=W2QNJ0_PHYN3|nr:hypothetical protein PPTG_22192 [Phytophthora nicotianae INRA-310]XP_008900611.1 hypothetical protein, variant [Phytophthora nicotianae INRA-310]ETN14068.1 hypothetical protein PPTG_22192 [Phytophthora nicotianae INRA-310]ETN14069.1 hypothetical protein, variant [Phytophthora nicotianae INRA-310]